MKRLFVLLAACALSAAGVVAGLGLAGIGQRSELVGSILMMPAMVIGAALSILRIAPGGVFVVSDGFLVLTPFAVVVVYFLPAALLCWLGVRRGRK
jgi:hypothetical protein